MYSLQSPWNKHYTIKKMHEHSKYKFCVPCLPNVPPYLFKRKYCIFYFKYDSLELEMNSVTLYFTP